MKKAKTGGRKKGVSNKITTTIRESLRAFMECKRPDVEKAFDKLSNRDKVNAYAKFLPFITPSYSSINFELSNMTDEDLEIIETYLRKKYSENSD